LLGHWKDYEELEDSLSMPELTAIVTAKRNKDHDDRKFFAAIQGIDLDEGQEQGQKQWEDLKAKVFSGGKTENSNDIVSLQGQNASKVGFGIGMGLEYSDMTSP
jgi:translation initiation factor 1 (eIF-1/SUI1)